VPARLPFEYVGTCTGPVVDTTIIPAGFPICDDLVFETPLFAPNLIDIKVPDLTIPPFCPCTGTVDATTTPGNTVTVGGQSVAFTDVFPNLNITNTTGDCCEPDFDFNFDFNFDPIIVAIEEELEEGTEDGNPFYPGPWKLKAVDAGGGNWALTVGGGDILDTVFWGWRMGSAQDGTDFHKDPNTAYFPNYAECSVCPNSVVLPDTTAGTVYIFMTIQVADELTGGNPNNDAAAATGATELTVRGPFASSTYPRPAATIFLAPRQVDFTTTKTDVPGSVPSGITTNQNGFPVVIGQVKFVSGQPKVHQIQYGQIDARQALVLFDENNSALVFQHNTKFFVPITQAEDCP
jgi:hypothetical protein